MKLYVALYFGFFALSHGHLSHLSKSTSSTRYGNTTCSTSSSSFIGVSSNNSSISTTSSSTSSSSSSGTITAVPPSWVPDSIAYINTTALNSIAHQIALLDSKDFGASNISASAQITALNSSSTSKSSTLASITKSKSSPKSLTSKALTSTYSELPCYNYADPDQGVSGADFCICSNGASTPVASNPGTNTGSIYQPCPWTVAPAVATSTATTAKTTNTNPFPFTTTLFNGEVDACATWTVSEVAGYRLSYCAGSMTTVHQVVPPTTLPPPVAKPTTQPSAAATAPLTCTWYRNCPPDSIPSCSTAQDCDPDYCKGVTCFNTGTNCVICLTNHQCGCSNDS